MQEIQAVSAQPTCTALIASSETLLYVWVWVDVEREQKQSDLNATLFGGACKSPHHHQRIHLASAPIQPLPCRCATSAVPPWRTPVLTAVRAAPIPLHRATPPRPSESESIPGDRTMCTLPRLHSCPARGPCQVNRVDTWLRGIIT